MEMSKVNFCTIQSRIVAPTGLTDWKPYSNEEYDSYEEARKVVKKLQKRSTFQTEYRILECKLRANFLKGVL